MIRSARRSRFSAISSCLLALVAGMSCGHLVDPPLPGDAQLFDPPAVYAKWWSMVESCSGIQGSLENIHWYWTSSQLVDPHDNGQPVDGYWSRASNRIVLNGNDTIAGSVVRHEMLHALVQVAGHPRSEFLEKCGGVVTCTTACVADAGPPPSPAVGTPTVSPSQLEVTSSVVPTMPTRSVDGGLATLIITAHNPLTHAVIVQLPPRSGGGLPRTFSYSMLGRLGAAVFSGDLEWDVGVTYFAPGETKIDIIDFMVAPTFPNYQGWPGLGVNGIALTPDTYTFQTDYGGKAAPNLTVVLGG